MERETGIEPATFSFGRWPSRIVQQRMFGQLSLTAHSTRNLVMASVQRCAAQHPGRRAAETVCRQFQCPRLHFSRRHIRQIWLSWRHGLPLGTEIWGGEDAEFEPRCLRRTWRLSRFWPTTWKRSPSVSPAVAAFGSLNRRLRQQTATCVLRRLNTEICPAKGPVAVDAGALSLIAFRRPRQPSWRGPDGWCRAPRTACRAVSPGAFAASGGVLSSSGAASRTSQHPPVLVWVKGKDVTFEKAASSHRFHVEVKAAKRPATTGGETPATRVPGFTAMRSESLIRALAWRPRGPCPTRRPAVAVRSVRRVRARKNGCIFSSLARSIPLTVGSIDPRHHLG